MPELSFTKSTVFAFNVIVMISAGTLWILKSNLKSSFNWLYLVLIVAILSGIFGRGSEGNFDNHGSFTLYRGLDGNSNGFGFLCAITTPLIIWKLYINKMQIHNHRWTFLAWVIIFVADFYFLLLR